PRLATLLCRTAALQAPLDEACAQIRPTGTLLSGASAVIFIEISPVFDTLKTCASNPCGVSVPLNVSTWFLDGSTMPPQLMVKSAAAASASAAVHRGSMNILPVSRFWHSRDGNPSCI